MDYAQKSNQLRTFVAETPGLKRAVIVGKRALEFGYPFAIGHKGTIVGVAPMSTGEMGVILFTPGGRIWRIPVDDIQED